MSKELRLKRIPAKFGCAGCYYENRKDCPLEEAIEGVTVSQWPALKDWECNNPSTDIFVEDKKEIL